LRVHLAHPQGNDWGKRRVKNDERDARDLADLLRLGRLAEAWIAPPETRELREMVRFRAKLSNLRTGLKAQAHAVMAKNGVIPCRGDMWGVGGAAQLDALRLPDAYENRLGVLRDLIAVYDREITAMDRDIHIALRADRGYQAVQAIYGVGPVFAAVFVADRRRHSLPHRRGVVLVGGAHPHPSRVRHQGHPRSHHQTRLEAGAVGSHGSRGSLPRRRPPPRQLPCHRRAARQEQGPSGDCSQAAHAGLLRVARRRDPLSPSTRRSVTFGARPGASSTIGRSPSLRGEPSK
jgi:hypothetical protein